MTVGGGEEGLKCRSHRNVFCMPSALCLRPGHCLALLSALQQWSGQGSEDKLLGKVASDLPPAINLCISPQAAFSQFRLYVCFISLKVQGLRASQSAFFETNIATNYTVGFLCVQSKVLFLVPSNCTAAIDGCCVVSTQRGDQSLCWPQGHISFSLFLSLIPATGIYVLYCTELCSLTFTSGSDPNSGYTLSVTSYGPSSLSPSYSLLFINHPNWAGMLRIESTGHARAVIPMSSPKLTPYTGSFLHPAVPKRPRRVRPHHLLALLQKPCRRRAWRNERHLSLQKNNTFKRVLSLCTCEWQLYEFSGVLYEGQSF